MFRDGIPYVSIGRRPAAGPVIDARNCPRVGMDAPEKPGWQAPKAIEASRRPSIIRSGYQVYMRIPPDSSSVSNVWIAEGQSDLIRLTVTI